MKKLSGVLSAALFSLTFVSAADRLSTGLSRGMNQVLDAVKALLGPFLSAILGGTGETLFQKVLFFAIILSLVYIIIKQMPVFKDNKTIIWIVTISVSLLSTRFMSADLLKTMLLPYTVLGVAITAVIPLIIFFAFAQGVGNKYTRKIMWILFAVTFLTIWSSRYAEVGAIAWIYFGTAMISLFFFLFDGTIRRLRIKQKMEELNAGKRQDAATEIRKRLAELETDKTKGFIIEGRYRELKRKLEKQLREITKF